MLIRLMGMILGGCAMVGGAVLAVTTASAQNYDPKYPVCMTLTEWGGSHIVCSFTSIAQCKETASGRAAQCDANPFYGYDRRGSR
jgi:Protein of unknown function (DUF3551)